MPKSNKSQNKYKITVSEYLRRQDAKTYTPFIIKADGTCGYIFCDKIIPRQEFERMNRVPASLVINNSENYCTTNDWLQ